MLALPIFAGSDGSAASGGHVAPRCLAADEAEHKRVPGSIADAAGLSARKISGTPNGRPRTGPRNRQGGPPPVPIIKNDPLLS